MIKCTLQKKPENIFKGVLKKESQIDLVVCNPPFHSSTEEAQRASKRKIKNLTGEKVTQAKLNFSGINNELIYEGGEFNFIQKMILESKIYSKNCAWFTTLLSKESNLNGLRNSLKKAKVNQIKIIPMGTSNKSTRIIAWTFLSNKELSIWQASRWK
jgi:23S rRNA (adenine1618-N6)-methyltransferase